jgi:antitoxin (DNA-binding transcriptional repressor) of toxin-antitoxin stability system
VDLTQGAMNVIGIKELQSQLSQVTARVAAGEEFVVTHRGKATLRIVPFSLSSEKKMNLQESLAYLKTIRFTTDDPNDTNLSMRIDEIAWE